MHIFHWQCWAFWNGDMPPLSTVFWWPLFRNGDIPPFFVLFTSCFHCFLYKLASSLHFSLFFGDHFLGMVTSHPSPKGTPFYPVTTSALFLTQPFCHIFCQIIWFVKNLTAVLIIPGKLIIICCDVKICTKLLHSPFLPYWILLWNTFFYFSFSYETLEV